jgi:SWI/SNF-related matrix-associated actin-dependent regulator of chromatin subfamily A-like protein 1
MNDNGKLVPFPYQKDVVLDVEDFNGRAMISAEMGLGKTAMALWVLKRQKIQSYPAVVVCPASTKYIWEHEAIRIGIRPTVLEGTKPPESTRKSTPPRLTILNYDILKHWLPHLLKQGVSTVIYDESQYIANRRAGRTKAALKLGRQAKHVIALSGTPLVNRPAELWPTLHVVRPDLYPSFWTFCQRFCRPRRTPWGWDFSGASNLDILHSTLTRQMMVRRLKKDVLKDLPEKMRCVVPVEISDRKEYELARDDFVGWLKSRQADRVQSALRAQQMTQIGYLLRLCARLKLRAVVDWCNEFLSGSDEKLVVFAVHRKMIEALDRRLEGGKHVVIDGQVGGRLRKAAVDQFQRDPSTRVLIGNVKAAGVGLTLTAASNVAFAELYWTPGAMTQAEDRCHRIGTTSTVWAHYLVAHGTIEERLCKAIQEKQATIRTVLDGGAEEDDLSILDMLVSELAGPGLLK